jgi:hypothetical protein
LWGERAGQRFHDFAAIAEIIVAIGTLFLVEHAIRLSQGDRSVNRDVRA